MSSNPQEQIAIAYQQLQILEQNGRLLVQQYEAFNQLLSEVQNTQSTLNAIEEMGSENEVLIPIGSNVLLHGKVTNNEKLLQFIGASIYKEKSIEEAKITLKSREESIKEALKRTTEELNKINSQIAQLDAIIKSLSGMVKQQQ